MTLLPSRRRGGGVANEPAKQANGSARRTAAFVKFVWFVVNLSS